MTEYEFYKVNEAVLKIQRHYITGLDRDMRDVMNKEKAAGITGEMRAEQAAAIIDAVIKSIDDIFDEIERTDDTASASKYHGLTQAAAILQKNIKAALLSERGRNNAM